MGHRPRGRADDPVLARALAQLAACFARARQGCDRPLALPATSFDVAMRAAMLASPCGETRPAPVGRGASVGPADTGAARPAALLIAAGGDRGIRRQPSLPYSTCCAAPALSK